MNVTATARQVTDYSFVLSAADLERYLADPQAWADDVRAQLNGAAPISGGGGRSVKTSPTPKGLGHEGRAGARGRRSSKMLACPMCQKPFKTQGRLTNHLKKMHPEYAGPAGE